MLLNKRIKIIVLKNIIVISNHISDIVITINISIGVTRRTVSLNLNNKNLTTYAKRSSHNNPTSGTTVIFVMVMA